jgi:aminoacyl-tRNA hydrolase
MVRRTALARLLERLLGEPEWDRVEQAPAGVSGRALLKAARLYRHTLLRRVTFIGVTGSAGKTMTKELLAAILSTKLTGVWNRRNLNRPRSLARTILDVRPWHEFSVLEIAGNMKPLEVPLRLVAPRIGVVTTVGTDHISAFRTIDAIAAEKSKLVACLPPAGTAVLNADDARVLAMQAQCRARVMTFGLAASADVRAEDVQGGWPDRLSFTIVHGGQSHRVQTQLCGVHWVPSVLAAVTAALAIGIPLGDAVEAVAMVPPFVRRMSPTVSPDGVTFIRDDAKAPLWSIPLSLQFLKDARASRRIIVIGTISDYLGNSRSKYLDVVRQAMEVADHVMVVGPRATTCLKAKRHPTDDAVHAARSVEAARQHLERLLRPGDLVLLKGSRVDRLQSLVDTRIVPSGERPDSSAANWASIHPGASITMVVGLGNPADTYVDTPHNTGQRALELLAASLDAAWTTDDDAMVARVEQPQGACYLVKPLTRMNETGPALRRLVDRLGVGADKCILLHDDVDLPIGTVRTRLGGGDGGHRGVRSVLAAFQSDAARRVKIGVGRPEHRGDVARHVLAPFDAAELPIIDKACADAAARALALAGMKPSPSA